MWVPFWWASSLRQAGRPAWARSLSTILLYASTAKSFTTGVVLLASYSLGLGIPFFLASLAFNSFLSAFEKIKRYMRAIMIVSGVFLIIIGILLLTDLFTTLNSYVNILALPD